MKLREPDADRRKAPLLAKYARNGAPLSSVVGYSVTAEETVLGWLGVTNFFVAKHVPPKNILNYSHQCQFRNPPPFY